MLLAALATQAAAAATIVTPKPTTGTPTQSIALTGSGFAGSEAVDVYFDTADTLLLVTSADGTLTGTITIPTAATPGAHSITAIGRHSGDAAQHSLTISTPWTKFGYGGANLGLNPFENVLSTTTVPSLGTLWENTIGSSCGTPVVNNNHVYVATSSGVAALNAATGATMWSKNLGGSFDASPTLVNTTLYIGSLQGVFYALNANTGATLWSVTLGTGGIYSSAGASKGILYVGTASGMFYALDPANKGQVVWSYTVGNFSITTTPAIANGNVYFGAYNDYVYCLNAASGAFVWKYLTGNSIDSSPTIANGVLYIGTYDKNVYAISTAPGTAGVLQWSYATNGGIVASPTVANGIVYIGSGDGYLYGLNARTGTANFALPTNGNVVRSAVTANGVVYFTTDHGTLFATNSYGTVLASGSTGGTFLGSPAVSDGRLYVAAASGAVYALAPNAGADVARLHAPVLSSLHPDFSLQVTH